MELQVTRAEPVGAETAGEVMVDRARLMFADADALGAWQHEEPLDGKADGVFWGRDAAAIAARCNAPALNEREYGWLDHPVDEAADRLRAAKAALADDEKAAFDFRPHSHHHQLMEQIRDRDHGTVDIGNARLCGFHTSWGDGMRVGFDAYNAICRVGIFLADWFLRGDDGDAD